MQAMAALSCTRPPSNMTTRKARLAHEFPIDMESVEVKQMVYATQNTGRPFPQVAE